MEVSRGSGLCDHRRSGMARATARLVALLAATGSVQLGAQEYPPKVFTDATSSHLPRDPDLHALDPVLIDVDRDGDLDIVLAVEYAANRLYINDGQGRFAWREGAFGYDRHDSEHVRAADFDGDGNMDVVFVAESDEVHQLFMGDGRGGFIDASARLPANSQGNGLAVGDVNGDGLPDIVVGNTGEPGYVFKDGKLGMDGAMRPAHDFLWLNDRARPGHFIDATRTHLPPGDNQTENVRLADMDGDGDLDMLTASPTLTNRLLLNDGKGHFTDASNRLDLKVPLETREVHVIDANRDSRPDILYFSITSNNHGWEKDPQTRLLINDGKGRWIDESNRLPQHRFSSWGGKVIDFNHDGAPDIIVGAIEVPGFVPLQLRAWQNDGEGRFSDVTLKIVPGITVGRSWGIAAGDLDGDGKDDMVVGQWGTQLRLLLTDAAKVARMQPPFTLLRPVPKTRAAD